MSVPGNLPVCPAHELSSRVRDWYRVSRVRTHQLSLPPIRAKGRTRRFLLSHLKNCLPPSRLLRNRILFSRIHPHPRVMSQRQKKKVEKRGQKKGKEGTGRKAVSSLILTVKLALLGDPRLFPYEIEVEAGSDEVTLAGKVSSEAEKAAAADIASTVPTVKSVSNKLEVVKELLEAITHKQDDIITRHVKERFAKSATVTAANFDVKTEQGVVSLSGAVRFQVIVLEAVEAAKQVPGVKAVKTDKVRIESEG